jgi:ubiquinol-cytochrome c reductase cytochrome b/c1 subunit
LHRFYSLHFALPFIILIISFIHFAFLHEFGSNNPLGIPSILDNIPFIPYFLLKDTYGLLFVFGVFFLIIFLSPDLLGHPDNYQIANFLVTPAHIVPE